MSDKWQGAARQILAALDIAAEYTALGVVLVENKQPRETGWLPCRAIGREDKNPSAEVNVGDGPARGRYRDFGGDAVSMSLFDAAAKWGKYTDWQEARNAFAKKTDVKLPSGEESRRAMDKVEGYELTAVQMLHWARAKPGVEPKALELVGAYGGLWPRGLAPERQQSLLCVKMFGSGFLELDPTGIHSATLSGKKIRKFKGKGVAPDLIKTMTLGRPGIMGEHGLKHWAEAEVVWLVEGLSDLLAVQSILGDRTDHITTSYGGASYFTPEDHLPHFVGKVVMILYDNDDPGQNGARVQVGKLLEVADAVRNVVLPAGVNDVRDFIVAGNDYKALWKYSLTFDPVEPANKTDQLQPHQALLANLGIVVSGQVDGTDHVEVYSSKLHKSTLVRDINRLSMESALLAFGKVVEEHITDEKDSGPDKQDIKQLRRAIALEGGQKLLSNRAALGCGVWRVDGQIVLIGPRYGDRLNADGTLTAIDTPILGDQRLHFNGGPWYDRAALARHLLAAEDDKWVEKTFGELRDNFARWNNFEEETAPEMIAALVVASWIQTLWSFRPLVGVLGPTNCGKSMLLKEVIREVFGGENRGLVFLSERPTEAGFRQSVGDTAMVPMLDEFEQSEHRPKILELLRTSSRGGQIARGTTGKGGAILYGLKHVVWVGAIELNLPAAADANRFLLFHLAGVPEGTPAKIFPPTDEEIVELHDLGLRLLAFALRRYDSIRRRAEAIVRYTDLDVNSRLLELHSVPLSILAEAGAMGGREQADYVKSVLGYRETTVEAAESDEAALVRTILASTVRLPGGREETVAALLEGVPAVSEFQEGPSSERVDALGRVGIAVIEGADWDSDLVFVNSMNVARHLLHRTDYSKRNISLLLGRIEGVQKRARARLHGDQQKGVAIPYSVLRSLVGYEPARRF